MEAKTTVITQEGIKILKNIADTFFYIENRNDNTYCLARCEEVDSKKSIKISFDDSTFFIADEKTNVSCVERKEGKEIIIDKMVSDLKKNDIIAKDKTNYLDTPIKSIFDYNDGFICGMLYWNNINKSIITGNDLNSYNFAFANDKNYTVGFIKHLAKKLSSLTDTKIGMYEKDEHVFLSIKDKKIDEYFTSMGVSDMNLPTVLYESPESFRKGFLFAMITIRRILKKIKIGEEEKERIVINLSDKNIILIKELFNLLCWYGVDYLYDSENEIIIINTDGLDSILKNSTKQEYSIGGRVVNSVDNYNEKSTYYKLKSVSNKKLLIKYNYITSIIGG